MNGPKGIFKIAAADMDAGAEYGPRYAGKAVPILVCDDPKQVIGATIGGTVEVRRVDAPVREGER